MGDWGTAFGMLIAYIKEEDPQILTGEKDVDLAQLMSFYKASKKRFDEDIDFKQRGQLEVVALQQGEATSLKGWEIICEVSRKATKRFMNCSM